MRTVHAVYPARRRQLGAPNGRHDTSAVEAGARLIRAFEPSAIPRILQTADYARRALAEVITLNGLPDDGEEAVGLEMLRQQRLYDPGKRFEFVIGEPALRSQSCPSPVMRAQLDLVRALSNLETMEVSVLPTGAKLPFVPLHGFWLFDEELVSVETLAIEVQVRDPQEIALYVQVFGRLKAAARVGAAARALLTRIIEDWRCLEDQDSAVMNDRAVAER